MVVVKKIFYYIKIYSIIGLAVILLSVSDVAPDEPVIFTIVFVISIVCTRLLWLSVKRQEKTESKSKPAKSANRNINNQNKAA